MSDTYDQQETVVLEVELRPPHPDMLVDDVFATLARNGFGVKRVESTDHPPAHSSDRVGVSGTDRGGNERRFRDMNGGTDGPR